MAKRPTHALVRMVLGANATVRLTAAEYGAVAAAREALRDLLFLEEKFDLVVQNYLELETELLAATMEEIVSSHVDWRWFQQRRSLFNRRLLNLLSAARGYTDHVRHAAYVLLGRDTPDAKAIIGRFSDHYAASFGFRVMEALRNHAQHRGFPIHESSYNSEMREAEARNRFKFAIAIYTNTATLRADGVFKASVLRELEAEGERVDLKPLARDYVAALSETHDHLRDAVRDRTRQWDTCIHAAIAKWRRRFPRESIVGLAAVVLDGAKWTQPIPLFTDHIEYRQHLAKKNSGLKRLGLRYASGETVAAK